MPKRLMVHVGANKTGSSAIQRFLGANSATLRSEGIIVPDNQFETAEKVQGDHVFGFQRLLNSGQKGKQEFERAMQTVDEQTPNDSVLVLSAENLTANPHAPSFFENLKDRFDIEVIMYIRRQDEYILSSWQQWNSKVSSDFWAWIVSIVGRLGNWQAYLRNWEKVIPRKDITVRIYERSRLVEQDVIADFCNLVSVSRPMSDFVQPKHTINPSYSDVIMDLVVGNSLVFKNSHDNDFYNFVGEMTGDKYLKSSRQSSITFAQRRAILDRYKEINNWVKESYFPIMEGELFSPPRESDYEYVSQGEAEKQKLEFLTTMMYQMYKRESE